ncbi:helix-turn-helix domain-containing protein [Levilactobacillus yiduensis]|uniref:helix-turn-helix domain-containing protein n=1 Tax=Levilactobacillus yiduensis TaxID=2953880 RepID=UPI000EF2E79C|nr:helix-turn-helix domain-containing protein [Levilactobacillus yiduensis]AYM02479.1 helix-turn-helix domain-containing protein [Levilactobacillus brevis]
MSNQLTSEKTLDKISTALDDFVKLSQISAVFFNLDGLFVHNQTVYTSFKESQFSVHFPHPIFFPLAVDHELIGFVVCENKNLLPQRIKLCRRYLERIIGTAFESHIPVNVWAALSQRQELLLNYQFNQILQPTTDNELSLQPHLAPSTTVNEDVEVVHAPTQDATQRIISKTIQFIENHLTKSFSLEDAAQYAFLSTSYLSRLFKQVLNVNFGDYVMIRKIVFAQELLLTTEQSIQDISTALGFSQTSYFTRVFKQRTGITPSKYRLQNGNTSTVYTIARPVTCSDSDSVYDLTKQYLTTHHIKSLTQLSNGYPYIQSINGLTNIPHQRGWVYLVDGRQPSTPASEVLIANCSVVQWIYTTNIY